MATLVIGGRSFEIAPYMIGALRQAAPIIDVINASFLTWEEKAAAAAENNSAADLVAGMLDSIEPLVAFMAIGLQRDDPKLTAEALEKMVGIGDAAALATAYREILAESGFTPKGEAKAPPAKPRRRGASTSN